MVNLLYSVIALVCALVVFILPARTRTNLDTSHKTDKAFLLLIRWTGIFCLTDAIWGVLASEYVMNDLLLFIFSSIFHLLAAFTPFVWLHFLLSYIGENKRARFYKIFTLILFCLEVVIITLNIWNHKAFWVAPNGEYKSGAMRNFLFYAQYFTYIFMAFSSLANIRIKTSSRNIHMAVLAFVAAPILCGIFQQIYPDAPAYSIGYMLGCCVIYSFIVTELLESRIKENLSITIANEAKTSFLFNMSHDIRTPMNAIIGFTQLAKSNTGNPERMCDYLNKIEISGKHLIDLINEALDMSRIEAGKLHSEIKPVDLLKAAEDLVSICQESASAHKVKISLECKNVRNSTVFADELHVNQIIMNILSNAIKYSLPGGSVNYSIFEEEDEGANREYARFNFVIEDNGIGMSQEFLGKIYDSFSREDTAVVSSIQGTGLGMSIVKKLVDYLDGTIKVESTLNKGTKVSVSLPFKLASPVNEIEKSSSISGAELSGKRILLVEDNDLNREIANVILSEKGIVVDEATNGHEAVECIRNKGVDYYDFVLMDIQMPFMNGYEATAEIRKLPQAGKLVIIALSANAFEEDKKASIAAGMNDHLAKPIDFQDMIDTLSKYL